MYRLEEDEIDTYIYNNTSEIKKEKSNIDIEDNLKNDEFIKENNDTSSFTKSSLQSISKNKIIHKSKAKNNNFGEYQESEEEEEIEDDYENYISCTLNISKEKYEKLTEMESENYYKSIIKGDDFYKSKKYKDAYDEYCNAAKLKEKNIDISLYYKLGDVATKLSLYSKALKNYKKAYLYGKTEKNSYRYPSFKYARILINHFEDHPKYGENIVMKICCCLKYSLINNFKALKFNIEDSSANFNLGCILGLFSYDECLEYFTRAEENTSDKMMKLKIYEEIAKVKLVDPKLIAKQLKYMDIAIEIDDKNDVFYYRKANIKLDSYNESIELYKKAIELNPTKSLYQYELGYLYYSSGIIQEAKKCIEKAINLNEIAHYYHGYGLILYIENKNNSYIEALKYFRKALEMGNYKASILNILEIHNEKIHSIDKEQDLKIIKERIEKPKYFIIEEIKAKLKKELDYAKSDKIGIEESEEDNEIYELNQIIQSSNTHFDKAILFLSAQNYVEAIKNFDIVIEKNPNNFSAINNKGMCYSKLGQFKEAIVCFDKAINLKPDSEIAYSNKGGSLSSLGQDKEAIDCFDIAIQLKPKNYSAINNKGLSIANLGNHKEAIECFEKAIDMSPYDPIAYINKGISLNHLGQYKEAIDNYDLAIKFKPDNSNVFVNKGISIYNLNHFKEAITCFEKAIDLNPNDSVAFRKIGDCLGKLEEYEEAIVYYDLSINLNQVDKWTIINKGIAFYNQSRYDEARDCYYKVIDLNPYDPDPFYYLALIYRNKGQFTEALSYCDKIQEIDPTYFLLHKLRDEIYFLYKYDSSPNEFETNINKYKNELKNNSIILRKVKSLHVEEKIFVLAQS